MTPNEASAAAARVDKKTHAKVDVYLPGSFTPNEPQYNTIADVMKKLKEQLGEPDDAPMRLVEVMNNNGGLVYPDDCNEDIKRLPRVAEHDFVPGEQNYPGRRWLFAERIPRAEQSASLTANIGPCKYGLLSVVHTYMEGPRKVHFGCPLTTVIAEVEPLYVLRARIQQRLGVDPDIFKRWKLACWYAKDARPIYLDSDAKDRKDKQQGAQRQDGGGEGLSDGLPVGAQSEDVVMVRRDELELAWCASVNARGDKGYVWKVFLIHKGYRPPRSTDRRFTQGIKIHN